MKAGKLFYLLLGSLVIYFGLFLFSHRQIYLQPFNSKVAEDRYFNSSYGKIRASYILSDEELYATEGYFLIHGKDLHQLTPGHPPLGKYLIGLSIIFFSNPYFFAPIFGLLALWLLYSIACLLGLPPLLSLILTSLFSFEPLFIDQLTTSLLDIYLLVFSLTGLYFYLSWFKRPHFLKIALSQLFLGLALATKFFPVGFPLLGSLLLVTVFTGKFKLFLQHTAALSFILLGFFLGHLTYFFYHPSPLEFFRYQRYVLSWWAGSPQVPPLQVFDLIFMNRWHTWWEKEAIISTPFWWPGWPVLLISSLFTSFYYLIRKNLFFLPLVLWLIFSLFLFSFEAVYPRHLLVIFPSLYLLTGGLLSIILKSIKLK